MLHELIKTNNKKMWQPGRLKLNTTWLTFRHQSVRNAMAGDGANEDQKAGKNNKNPEVTILA